MPLGRCEQVSPSASSAAKWVTAEPVGALSLPTSGWRLGRCAPSIHGWAAYLHGERLAERDPTAATRHLTDAIAAAEEVDDRFLVGVARHTLMTTAARTEEAGSALTSFAGLLDQWNGSGAWTQLWLTVRALIEALSRGGHHREAAVLLGAYATSPGAPAVFGADAGRLDAAAAAARHALGDDFDALWCEGVALGDQRAITLAIELTRPGYFPDAS